MTPPLPSAPAATSDAPDSVGAKGMGFSSPMALTPRRELWLLFTLAGIQFTHILDFMIMMPLGPVFTRIFAISDAQFGLLVSAYTFAAGASGLVATTYVDKFGRKRLLLALYALFALATLACAMSPTYAALMTARIFAGVFGGVLSALSQTIVGDVIPFERRGRAMGVVMSSFSVSTVAGVPLGLWLATTFNWHAPFFLVAGLCALLGLAAWRTLPPLAGHMAQAAGRSTIASIKTVLADRNHQKTFVFSGLLMFAGFTMIPFITIFTTVNVGLPIEQVPLIYLCGGVATLFTARIFGRMTDLRGKVPTFTLLALATLAPMVGLTLLPRSPVWVLLVVTTLFFICMSGRMIPGMAIITSAANPALRGTFMTLNGSVQSAAMGLASFIGGLIISRDAAGLVQHYWGNALVGALASVLAMAMVRRLTLHGAPSSKT